MHDILIALLLLAPIVIVIAILKRSHKNQKKKRQDQLNAYLAHVAAQEALTPSFEKHLVHQMIVLDEANRKLLVIDQKGGSFSHELFLLDEIRNVRLFTHTDVSLPAGKDGKSENFTTAIGVELITGKTGASKFLTLYDHVEHNIYQMSELEAEARQLQAKIAAAKGQQKEKV